MNQGRRRNQEQNAYTFCGLCFLAMGGLIGIAMAGSEGSWFPWANFAGVAVLIGTIKLAGRIKP